MANKNLKSEADLSYAESEVLRDIVDHQLKQKHNQELIEDIVDKRLATETVKDKIKLLIKEAGENLIYKKIVLGLWSVLLFVAGIYSTNFINKYNDNLFKESSSNVIADVPVKDKSVKKNKV